MERFWETERGMEISECGAYVLYADAQATIAALQVVIDDHNRLVREMDVRLNGEQGAAKQASLCDIVSQVQQIQAQLTQRTAECDALKLVNDTHMKTVMKLSSVVESTHADLARVTAEAVGMVEWKISLQGLTPGGSEFCDAKSCEEWVRRSRESHHGYLMDEIKRRKALQTEIDHLRTLIAALPKVEGEIRVEEGKVISVEPVRGADPPLWWRRTIATFEDGLLAKHYSKLLQHRQGMEG